MTTTNTFAATQRSFRIGAQSTGQYFSLPELAKTYPNVNRLPVSLRIVLESVLRNCDGKKVTEAHVHQLANWQPNADARRRDPVRRGARGAAGFHRRAAARRPGGHAQRGGADWASNPKTIEPLVPVDLVVDHSVMIDHYGSQERARPQHEARVPAQPRALRVHEVGHAGVRHLRRRAAGLRHRAPGEPRVPGARRAQERGRRVLPRHAGGHRQPHHDDQRHRRGRAGASAASRPRPACWASRCTS